MVCPNRNLQEYKDLAAIQGYDKADLLWIANDGQVPDHYYNKLSKPKEKLTEDNTKLADVVLWLKTVFPDANLEFQKELINGIANGSFNSVNELITLSEKFANKKTAKHELFHLAFNRLPKEKKEQILNEGSKLFGIERGESKATIKYSQAQQNEVNYLLKAVDILQSDKAKQVFEKGNKNNWSLEVMLDELGKSDKDTSGLNVEVRSKLNKLQQELTNLFKIKQGNSDRAGDLKTEKAKLEQELRDNEISVTEEVYNIPKEQRQLILDLGITDREQLALELATNYSYTVEINTAKNTKNNKGDVLDNEFNANIPDYIDEDIETVNKGSNTDYYANLTVPGGTNYTEQEISTPLITPSIKGHAQFATDNGIGWFRSDDKAIGNKIISEPNIEQSNGMTFIHSELEEDKTNSVVTKTRRILEVQSDLFQKGRDKEDLTTNQKYLDELSVIEGALEYGSLTKEQADERLQELNKKFPKSKNQFLQLLNKDNNWVQFFVKSIIQDSAKKGYEKVLFPTGNTASKVEGHTTLEEFKKQKEDRIKELEKQNNNDNSTIGINNYFSIGTVMYKKKNNVYHANSEIITKDNYENNLLIAKENNKEKNNREITQLKQELERVETEGLGALKPIYNFYENTVSNILNKTYGKENVISVTDEFGNTWLELDLFNPKVKSQSDLIKFQSSKLEYAGDLAIEEKIAEMMEDTKDENLPKSVIGKWIQSVRNFFRNLYKEKTAIERLMRDINQGRIEGIKNKDFTGVKYQLKNTEVKESVKELFESNSELANIGTSEQYSQYLDNMFSGNEFSEIDNLLYNKVLIQLEQSNIIEKDCNGKGLLKAKNGIAISFTKGSKWELVKDLKGYPSHSNGGVDIKLGKDGFSFAKEGGGIIKAKHGVVLPKIN